VLKRIFGHKKVRVSGEITKPRATTFVSNLTTNPSTSTFMSSLFKQATSFGAYITIIKLSYICVN
jgi:hypothetical protein